MSLGLKVMPTMLHYAKKVTPLSKLDIRLLKGFYVHHEQELKNDEEKLEMKE